MSMISCDWAEKANEIKTNQSQQCIESTDKYFLCSQSLVLCAIELVCSAKTIKNASVGHAIELVAIFFLNYNKYGPSFKSLTHPVSEFKYYTRTPNVY